MVITALHALNRRRPAWLRWHRTPTLATPAPVVPAAPPPVRLTKPIPCGTGYPWSGGGSWLADEAAILLALSETGGDLAAARALFAPHVTDWPKETR